MSAERLLSRGNVLTALSVCAIIFGVALFGQPETIFRIPLMTTTGEALAVSSYVLAFALCALGVLGLALATRARGRR